MFFLLDSDDRHNLPCIDDRRSSSQSYIHFQSNLYVDIDPSMLTNEQWNLLNRGPTYVPSGQLDLIYSNVDDRTLHKVKSLRRQLIYLFNRYPKHRTKSMVFEDEIIKLFYDAFAHESTSSTMNIEQVAKREHRLVRTMKTKLKYRSWLLKRMSNEENSFYLGHVDEYQRMVDQYFKQQRLQVVEQIDDEQQLLERMINEYNQFYEQLLHEHKINVDIYQQLKIDKKTMTYRLPYMQFRPVTMFDCRRSYYVVESSIDYRRTPIYNLAQYLDRLLRPLFEQYSCSTTLIDEFDFIEQLTHNLLVRRPSTQQFNSATLFVTIELDQFYRTIKHETMVECLIDFLVKYKSNYHVEQLSLVCIQQLIEFFLRQFYGVYERRLYRYDSLGLPNVEQHTTSLWETLTNIVLFQWQSKLIQHPLLRYEFFGRSVVVRCSSLIERSMCKNFFFFFFFRHGTSFFMTFNGFQETFERILVNIHEQTPSAFYQRTLNIGKVVRFMNLSIENRQGFLHTTTMDQPTKCTSYRLPYMIGHARCFYMHYFQYCLLRSLLICSSMNDFVEQTYSLEVTYLLHGFPYDMIERKREEFFYRYQLSSVRSVSFNPVLYDRVRQDLLHKRIANNIERRKKNVAIDSNSTIYNLYYLYDRGPRCWFNRKFQELWTHYIDPYPILNHGSHQIRLRTKQIHSLNTLLARRDDPDEQRRQSSVLFLSKCARSNVK